ncbi:MAG: hybrid sensor histidine kinase/response regulator transcription factor, partial [Bacteroidota bacterium]
KTHTVHSIEEGEPGQLWFSTNNGIFQYDIETGSLKLFEESNGLISNEFNNHSSFKSASGRLFFGGPEGVCHFDPFQMVLNHHTPHVVLSNLYVNGQRIFASDASGILENSIWATNKISLAHDESIFTISFALPNYVNPKKNSYQFRLIGLNDSYTFSEQNTASYTIQEPGEYTFEVLGTNNDGFSSAEPTSLTVEVRPAPWRSWWAFLAYGLVILLSLYGLTRSIQSRAKLRHELQLKNQTSEQEKYVHQLKLQFFTNISHEFRTPLTLIIGPLKNIIQEYKGSKKLFKQLLTVEKNADHLLKLINQLMDFRKIESKQSELHAAEGNIVKFAKEVFLSFKTLARQGAYQYEFIAERDEIKVFYDRDKMERVFYNLLSNAFKYTPKGGIISMQIKEADGEIIIAIKDTGIGLEKQYIERVFDRFYRVDEPYDAKIRQSTGIGLALVRGIIELHKGKVRVYSDGINKGSEFVVSVPLGINHLSEDQLIPDFKDSENLILYENRHSDEFDLRVFEHDEPPLNTDKRKLLIVEDNDQLRSFILDSLDEYQLLEATNGKEGLKLAINESPDLILSDVMMPEMDGIELCTKVKNDVKTSHIPVLLLTARTSLIFKYEGLESGADDYINKPFDIRELKIKINNQLKMVDNLRAKFSRQNGINPSEVTVTSIDEDLMKKAIDIVDRNIDNEFLNITLFCQELGVSRTVLFSKVKAWTNLTPNEFILSMRMKRAAQLLEQNKASVSQVCYMVGYKNPKYFSKCFQKFHSVTPTQYASKFKVLD